jgi:nitric oxide reductase subunit B
MRYESQRVAYPYFVLSAILFGLQIVFGLIIAAQFVWPDFLSAMLPFNVGREIHLNTMVFWLLLGLMGATYYLVPEETEAPLYSTKLAKFQFWMLALTGVAAVIGFLFGFTEGREYIEAPRIFDWLIVVAVLVFLFNILRTILRGKWTAVLGVLLGGMAGLAVMYLFGMKFFANVGVDQYFWWWVIHLWVEGTWEMIAAAVLAFMLLKLTGAERKTVEKWLYIETILVLATGILGIGHHYYWIGTPKYWMAVGGFFSFLEPIPLVLMVLDTYKEYRKRTVKHANQVALLWIMGSVIVHFIGAGVMGVVQTLPSINQWTHGTQLTASHGHLAFFGAFAMMVIAAAYYMLPDMTGRHEFRQRRGRLAFWVMVIGMGTMSAVLFGAGIVQVYLQRMLGMDFTTVKTQFLSFWMFWRFIAALFFAAGVGIFIVDFFSLPVSQKKSQDYLNSKSSEVKS